MRTPSPLATLLQACDIAPPDDPVTAALEAVLGPPTDDHGPHVGHLPVPLPPCGPFPEGRLSPRLLVLLARAAPLQADQRILLVGKPLVALAALMLALPEDRRPAHVTVLTPDPARASWTADRLGHPEDASRLDIIGAESDHTWPGDLTARPFDHVLVYRAEWTTESALAFVADGGTATLAGSDGRDGFLVQHVRSGDDSASLTLHGHTLDTPPGDAARPLSNPGKRRPRHVDVGRLIAAEPMLLNVWRGVAPTGVEQTVLRAVRGTFDRDDAAVGEGVGTKRRLAERLFHLGYLEQVVGMRRVAEALYKASLDVDETAEAWTFYGWVRSREGSTQEAVDACRRAIEIDPSFGNPYNDIGAYLLAESDVEGAKRWFKRATDAPRYAAPHYPYTNLGRVFLREGDLDAARQAVEQALDMMPGYPPAERLMREIEAREAHDPRGR